MRFWLRRDKEVDFDFNILTAFIRLGRARPAGAGCPPYYLQALCPSYYFIIILLLFFWVYEKNYFSLAIRVVL